MTGLIFYIDENGVEKKLDFSGLRYDETVEEYLNRRGINFQKVIACNTNE